LYPGNQTSEKSLFKTIEQLEALLQLHDRHQRSRVLIRVDAGFGNDQNINWLLHRGYHVLSKHKSSKRASLIASQIDEWYPLDDRKWIAEVPKPLCHPYYRRTQTAVLCWYNPKSNVFKHALLICSLLDLDLFEISHLYDERASMENEIKADKGGLLLPKRRKKQLEAQEALGLLTDLAHNIVAWSRDFWAAEPKIGDLGLYGIVNKIMTIPGKLTFEEGKLVKARLQATHPLAKPVVSCLSRLLRDF
jgi:Transposase DDE domain group 1